MILAPPSEQIYLVVVKQGLVSELYAGILQIEFAVLSRAHCWKYMFNLSTVALYETPVTTSKQMVDSLISIEL